MGDLFEWVKGSIDKGIKTISSKGKELLETTKLKGEIKDVQSSIEGRFQALGKKVFEMINRRGLNEEELKVDCREITALFKRITELEKIV